MKNVSNIIRIIISLLLIAALSLSVLSSCKAPDDGKDSGSTDAPDDDKTPDDTPDAGGDDNGGDKEPPISGGATFVPVLRFAITSDVHVRSTSNDYGSSEKFKAFITGAYQYAHAEEYNKLDGLFVVGDLTQDGKTAEYGIVKNIIMYNSYPETVIRMVMGNHEFHAYGKGDERFNAENIAKSTERFKSELGYESEDSHHVINGYHFISIANDSYESRNYYDAESLAWLKGEIEAAMADDPTSDKPIFVMQHEPPHSDVRGFTGGDTELGELLKNYPRVVDFSGHTHRSILDPQSIWQDGFTAIGTGGLAYLGFNMAGHPTLDNSAVAATDGEGGYIGGASNAERTGAMYYIVEVDGENNIRLKIYDLLTGGFYGEPITFKVGEGEEEIFTPARAERSAAPSFSADAKIEVISTDYNYPLISFSTPTSGDLVQYYRIELWGEGSEAEVVFYRLGLMHLAANMPTVATSPIRGITHGGEYAIKIYAVNCWGKESEPLCGSITVDEPNLIPDILNTEFKTDGAAANGESELTKLGGGATVVYDGELGKNVASFSGASGYKFSGIKDYYDRIAYAVTMEAYFRVGEGLTDSVAIASNNNSAGFGLYRLADGGIRFNYSVNNGGGRKYLNANTAPGAAAEGEWVHVVAVCNGSDIRIYVNGALATLYDDDGAEIGETLDCSGRLFEAPSGFAAALVVGGDISSGGGLESGFVGDIAALNIYSRALTADEVGELYSIADSE